MQLAATIHWQICHSTAEFSAWSWSRKDVSFQVSALFILVSNMTVISILKLCCIQVKNKENIKNSIFEEEVLTNSVCCFMIIKLFIQISITN
ncbi:unnamed protein product [Blepharisma stoltei]|uniref:Uncharacterized protein n=1 Tax=Blepharisma stoltei TaxID=1481888 RepID=A0AAU9K897_9CILI|nr:unnamed protein product [Blepharisma stoltei]